MHAHGSGPMWFATPSSQWTCTTYSLPVSRRTCVKTLTKIFGQKIDRLERHPSYDRHLGNGFGTPNFYASLDNFEFLHWLGTKFAITTDCYKCA
jgi:hypothetical protein